MARFELLTSHDFIIWFAPYRALGPTFTPQNSFSKVGHRRKAQIYLYDLHRAPTFYEIDPS